MQHSSIYTWVHGVNSGFGVWVCGKCVWCVFGVEHMLHLKHIYCKGSRSQTNHTMANSPLTPSDSHNIIGTYIQYIFHTVQTLSTPLSPTCVCPNLSPPGSEQCPCVRRGLPSSVVSSHPHWGAPGQSHVARGGPPPVGGAGKEGGGA